MQFPAEPFKIKALEPIKKTTREEPDHLIREAGYNVFNLPGDIVPNNTHFDTTRANVLHNQGKPVDLLIDEGLNPRKDHPFKGNMDPLKLEKLLDQTDPSKVPLIMMTVTSNSAGGQPVSMQNIRNIHAIAKEFLPHLLRNHFPAQALTVALYREAGIRAVEIGGLMFGEKDAQSGKETYPEPELVRLAIPRRVYTSMHMNYVAESIINIYQNRGKIKGLKIVYEAPLLRHFTIRLEEID